MGSTNPGHQAHLDGDYWRAVRRAVWRRSGGRCERCGERGRQGVILDVHHLRYTNWGNELDNLQDVIMVCRDGCHAWLHGKGLYDPARAPSMRELEEQVKKFLRS